MALAIAAESVKVLEAFSSLEVLKVMPLLVVLMTLVGVFVISIVVYYNNLKDFIHLYSHETFRLNNSTEP